MKTFAILVLPALVYVVLLAAGGWLLLASGCAGTARDTCYATAETVATVEAQRTCFAKGFTWTACPEREHILEQLHSAYRSCP